MRTLLLCLCFVAPPPLGAGEKAPPERLLFDFEDAAALKDWSNLDSGKAREPAARIERSTEHATSGKHSLKITFAGGRWPTITTTNVPANWMPYWTFKADVTVGRHCVVGFTVLQEKSRRGGGWDATVSRWTKTEFLQPGTNTVVGTLHDPNHYSINDKLGKVVRFEIFMYGPHGGESIFVDNIRIAAAKETKPAAVTKFRVAGTELEVSGVRELGKTLKSSSKKPTAKTLDEVEKEFRARYEELKEKHPRAVLAILRDGEKGFDPARPDKVYAGWKDAYWSSHGPDGMTVERATNEGRHAGHEVFMRHRSPLMRVDLSSIPKGSTILDARLLVVRNYDKPIKEHNPEQPNMWVVEPCNRPWEEYEVNAYEYAKDKFWKAIGGMYYGPDPDFLPIYLAHGPSQGKVNVWDFTEAVRFWTDGKHENHGFMLHGDAGDWFARAHAREAAEVRNRPAALVIYE
ncbi:MAG: DNRLRE domain-containing protein [Gemmataceae bacterium]